MENSSDLRSTFIDCSEPSRLSPIQCDKVAYLMIIEYVTIQNGWNNRISYGCVYAQIRSGLGMHLVTYSNHDTVLFLLIVPIEGRFV